jgi:Planctomycete cytochrome C
VEMDLRYATATASMQLIGVANQGSVSGVRVVAGNHASSLLWQRAASTAGNVRMPPLGVQMVDDAGLQLLANWIDALR